MTTKDKLQRLIEKAYEKGWKGSVTDDAYFFPEHWIFNHDFAKALFGEEPINLDPMAMIMTMTPPKAYLFHLQKAVISEYPIDYMYKEAFSE